MGLVGWIANNKLDIDSNVYADDTFGAGLASESEYYSPYDEFFPAEQAQTLDLWDSICLNHEREKQLNGAILVVVGIEVDSDAMTFTMPESKRAELLAGVLDFCHVPPGGRRHPLKVFQRLGGWVNWSFNVYPLLKPALCHVYEKMKGKSNGDAAIFVNRGVVRDLEWFANHVKNSTGVHLLESLDWEPADADVVAFCDASLKGLGFYIPAADIAFQSLPPSSGPSDRIFYYEAFCVCWCLHQIAALVRDSGKIKVRKITIWTDSSNTYDIFNTLRAKPLYNEILKSAVDVLIANEFKLRVQLLPGKKNVVADALSRWRNDLALASHPNLEIYDSCVLPNIPLPPRDTLGAEEK
ncbi:hypothetical protein C8F04DRAFT_948861 [Mycena alexandri]|uniref:Uncharacterized protein n=1 Tax=Mycena alexandri TaxID=1745969 RepID=A0AAD6T6J8_9AGAR|nr:hypothetical protein C8F04DRAFT_948861 [Mycena alexandri]